MYFGLSNPWVGKLNEADGTYTNGFKCGSAVETSVDPKYVEAEWDGDNKTCGKKKRFQKADVILKATELPIEAATVMFGHTVSADKKSITFGGSDESNYVGYGFITEITDEKDSVDKVEANFLPKVKFNEVANQHKTNGTTFTISAPQIAGTALVDKDNNWKYVEIFATEAEAIAWLKTKLDIVA